MLGGAPAARTVSAGESLTFAPPTSTASRTRAAEPAITLHAYSPPLWRMGAYEVSPDRRAAPLLDVLRRGAAPDRGIERARSPRKASTWEGEEGESGSEQALTA